ncbi:helix-turn-helix transcriptional regulator [Streptomyces sp. NPDC051976]|uniref:helix-turn-helix domain-containing protein n=1 Tax=Streptomyces sp. NPDC051976 TaxID=3154947 RepID=UPI0034138D3E
MARDVLEEARHLERLLARPDSPLLDPVEQAVNLSRMVETLTAGLVGRARLGRVPWARLGPALAMQPDTARRTYRAEKVNRRMRSAERSGLPVPAKVPPPASPHAVAASHPRSHLAPVLARLHRASDMSLRQLADRLNISTSQASRILSGERFPSWHLTERLAHACGADPLVLRKVWEDEKLREEQPPQPGEHPPDDNPVDRLRVALQTLHIKAGRPAPEVLAEATRATCWPTEICAVLDGHIPHWPLLADLVQTLDGDVSYFHPLWEATVTNQPTTPTWSTPTVACTPAPATTPRPQPADGQLIHLFETFAPVLSASTRWP